MVSDAFVGRLRRSEQPQYVIAATVGVPPSWLSQVVHGAEVEPADPRILRIGTLLGLRPEEIFDGTLAVDVHVDVRPQRRPRLAEPVAQAGPALVEPVDRLLHRRRVDVEFARQARVPLSRRRAVTEPLFAGFCDRRWLDARAAAPSKQ